MDFHSFGDKNMLNSTGSNTGGWNTKNLGTNLITGQKGKRAIEQKSITTEGNGKRKKAGGYRNFGARQTKNGYRWDGNMRSGAAKSTPCEPTGYAYLAEQCVPTSRSKSKSNKSDSTGSGLDKRDQVNSNLAGGNTKDSNMTRSGNNNAV